MVYVYSRHQRIRDAVICIGASWTAHHFVRAPANSFSSWARVFRLVHSWVEPSTRFRFNQSTVRRRRARKLSRVSMSSGALASKRSRRTPLRTTSRLWSVPQWSDCRGARCLRTLSKVIDRPSDGEVLALHLGIAEPCLQMFMIALRTWCYTRPGADASSSPIDVSQRAVLFIYNCPLGRRRRAKPRSTPFLSRLFITVYY